MRILKKTDGFIPITDPIPATKFWAPVIASVEATLGLEGCGSGKTVEDGKVQFWRRSGECHHSDCRTRNKYKSTAAPKIVRRKDDEGVGR